MLSVELNLSFIQSGFWIPVSVASLRAPPFQIRIVFGILSIIALRTHHRLWELAMILWCSCSDNLSSPLTSLPSSPPSFLLQTSEEIEVIGINPLATD